MKTVIEMAREAGLVGGPVYARGLERFEALVRADEREACAKVCDDLPAPERMSLDSESFYECVTLDCADAIRARSNT
jgi:hypothetical protein